MCKVLPMNCKTLFEFLHENNLENADIPVCIVARCARTHSDVKEGPVTGVTCSDSYVTFTNIDTESYYEHNGKTLYIYGVVS